METRDQFRVHQWFQEQKTELVLAQTIEDPDVLGQMEDAFNNFVETGQVWALLIGLVLGYMFKSFTAY